ncbi:MAG: hypothetical protein HY851_02500 [candidate division Zixibacteria bacterium]|nr:hypothetical protein [candidate division Zixibacteria bacterium]
MNRKLLSLLAVLTAVLLLAGCSQNPTTPTTSTSLNLNSPTGGYTASNEPTAFGDPELQGSVADETAFNDPLLSSASVDSLMRNPLGGWFHFRAIWGHLVADSTESMVTDWTGKLEISHGALVLRKIIRFEEGDEVLPRTDPRIIEWVSHTGSHSDGVAVDLFVPRPQPVLDTTFVVDTAGDTSTVIDTTWPEPPTLTFTTPPYSRTFTLAELMKLDTVVTLSDSNEVAFWGMRMFRTTCPRGFVAGGWDKADSSGVGLFRGRWINRWGNFAGFYHGHYGINDHGIPVFFGKWIDSTGRFEGFLRGTWGFLPPQNEPDTRPSRGWFAGHIFDAGGHRVGILRGKLVAPDSPEAHGFMEGRWKLICSEEAAEGPGGQGGQGRGGIDDGMGD